MSAFFPWESELFVRAHARGSAAVRQWHRVWIAQLQNWMRRHICERANMISLSSLHPPPPPLSLPPPCLKSSRWWGTNFSRWGLFLCVITWFPFICVHEIERWKDEACLAFFKLTFLIWAQPLCLHYDAQWFPHCLRIVPGQRRPWLHRLMVHFIKRSYLTLLQRKH